MLTLPPPRPFLALRASCSSPAADASASCRGGGGSVEGWLSGCRFGLCVWSLLRGLWCAETAMAVGLLPLPPPRPSPAAGFALRGREWFGGRNVVRLSVWVVCLVVAPQVVCCPHPSPPPGPTQNAAAFCVGTRPQGEGAVRRGNVVRLSVWIVCLVVAPWVVVCRNGNGGWIAASTPSPTLPRCGLRPAGEGVVRLSVWGCGRLRAAP